MGWLADETGLDKCAANHTALTPLSFLRRAGDLFATRTAVIYGDQRFDYAHLCQRVSRLASGLARAGIRPGDVVATLLPNTPAHIEAHFGVPAAGAVLNAINTRLDVDTVAYIFGHGEARLLLVDSALVPLAEAAIAAMDGPGPTLIEVPDEVAGVAATGRHQTYEAFLNTADPSAPWQMPQDEWESLALNYTSGTTGRPKGVVYHHRGAYLMAMGTAIGWQVGSFPTYLTIVPLFHCNNWCHTWMMPALGGTIVCCRDVTARTIYAAIADHGVSHLGGAPIVLNMLINAKPEETRSFSHRVEIFTAGAPPPAATLAAIEPLGFNVTQVYGLTETYGHVTQCLWQPDWDNLQGLERTSKKDRTGVLMPMMEDISVHDGGLAPVPRDGATLGEIAIRGNCVMKGYYKSPEATRDAFKGGYFRTGDIAFQQPDGYIKITDRAKDIIISGGENISSVEVEGALMHHPAVLLCAVVAKPDDKWGEVPCAFVELKDAATATEAELIAFARTRLAGFKAPKRVIFTTLPKTSTGKIQKFELRTLAKTL